jgi:N4-gp56 family major capsid protein
MATQVYNDGTNVGGGTAASVGNNTKVHFYDIAGIKSATEVNIYGQFADKRSMPRQTGKVFKTSKMLNIYDRNEVTDSAEFKAKGYISNRTAAQISFGLNEAKLAEGSGEDNTRTVEKVTVETKLVRYGEMIKYTDEVALFSEDTMQVEYRMKLGDLANVRYEDLIQMQMLETPTRIYSGLANAKVDIGAGVAVDGTEDSDWVVSYDLIRRGVRKLVRNRAKKNKSMVVGSTKIGTKPIAQAYCAIVGESVTATLETITRGVSYERQFAFRQPEEYASADSLIEGEIGSLHKVRFIESPRAVAYLGEGAPVPAGYTGELAYTTLTADQANSIHGINAAGDYFDVHPILFPTQGAFATLGLKGKGKIAFHSQSPEVISPTNPYGTTGFFSYNMFYAGIILEPEKLLQILVAVEK